MVGVGLGAKVAIGFFGTGEGTGLGAILGGSVGPPFTTARDNCKKMEGLEGKG